MKTSPIIVLFGEPPPMRRGPSGFLVSFVLHVCVCGLLYLGLKQAHTVDSNSLTQRYAVRIMELRKPEHQIQPPVQKAILDPGQQPKLPPVTPGGIPQTASAAAQRIPLNFISQKQALQTIIQPQAPTDLTIQEVPLPQVVLWSSQDITVRKIVQPTPKKAAEVAVQPSLEAPNQEVHIADLKISSTAFDTKAPLPPPSTTSPISASAPAQSQKIPETASKDSGKPTSASVISLSNVQLQEGTAALPMINEVAPTPFAGSLSAGQPKSLSQTGNGKADGKENVASTGQTGIQNGKMGAASGAAEQGGANGLSGVGASVTSGANQPTVVHITLPKDGKFGVVVVGSSIAEDYPETVHIWSGRLAYTVYLHVGVAKNWILQYSIPRSQDAASAGSATRPDAPWPYDMTRPSIDADANADAIMVHGFVNTSGRFEQLAVVFPTELAEAKFLLHALQQWQFRPAMQNGQATVVEVLLIIPDQTE
jgi:hypothetical protein